MIVCIGIATDNFNLSMEWKVVDDLHRNHFDTINQLYHVSSKLGCGEVRTTLWDGQSAPATTDNYVIHVVHS